MRAERREPRNVDDRERADVPAPPVEGQPNISIPHTAYSCGIFGWSTCYETKWRIDGISRSSGTQQVRYADGTTENLYRLTFRQFRVDKDLTMATQPIAGAVNPGYTLTMKPDETATLGGVGSAGQIVYTDMWVTGDSSVRFDFNILGIGYTCGSNQQVSGLGIASWITVSVNGCGMDLNARYIVTTGEVGELEGQYSVRLPNTTIQVD